MSQIIVPSSIPTGTSNDVLMLTMTATGTTTSSGSSYDIVIGDDNYFSITASRGTSISLDGTNDKKVNLTAGLYQISFNGWVQTAANVTGTFSYEMLISSDPTFTVANVLKDRFILDYEGGNSVALVDPSHTTLLNSVSGDSLYFRITCSSTSSTNWYLRGDPTNVSTNLQIIRIGDAA